MGLTLFTFQNHVFNPTFVVGAFVSFITCSVLKTSFQLRFAHVFWMMSDKNTFKYIKFSSVKQRRIPTLSSPGTMVGLFLLLLEAKPSPHVGFHFLLPSPKAGTTECSLSCTQLPHFGWFLKPEPEQSSLI